MVWTLVEPGVAIIASSLVTVRPLLRQWRLKGFESTGRSDQRVGSHGRWGRYGRSSRRVSEIAGGNIKPRSNVPRTGPADVKLKDLESGYVKGSKNTSRETTLTSRTSNHDRYSGMGGGGAGKGRNWAGTRAVTVREDNETDDYDHDVISPVSPVSTDSESVFVIEGAPAPPGPRIRGHLQGGKPVWTRSEPPNSQEESEGSQGLRLPDGRSDGKPWPFS